MIWVNLFIDLLLGVPWQDSYVHVQYIDAKWTWTWTDARLYSFNKTLTFMKPIYWRKTGLEHGLMRGWIHLTRLLRPWNQYTILVQTWTWAWTHARLDSLHCI